MVGGPLEPKSAARLLLSAAFLDAVLVFLLTVIFAQLMAREAPKLMSEGVYLGGFVIILLIYWLITEIVLGGRTIGRTVLQLEARDQNGGKLSGPKRVSRGVRKVLFLGLTGLRIGGAAGYDRATGTVWHSPMAPRSNKPMRDWRLVVADGSKKGMSVALGQISTFRKNKGVRIGRDPKWADILLTNDAGVSMQHCVLEVHGSGLMLMDYGRDEQGSSNGTVIHGRRLVPRKWKAVGNADHFSVASIKILIKR